MSHKPGPLADDELQDRKPRKRGSLVFLIAVVALSLITVPICGGSLSKLGEVRLQRSWLIAAALGIQILIVSVIPGANPTVNRLLHLASYALAAAFLVCNRHIRGLWIVAVGAALNALAITANHGVMPASESALRSAGELQSTDSFMNSALLPNPRLLFLGDIFAIPQSWPLHNVFSIGDVCIALGAAFAIHALCGTRIGLRRAADAETVQRAPELV